MPNAFGYGIMVLECTEAQARKSLRKFYLQWKEAYGFHMTFPQAFEYFGGAIVQVETGKNYYDNLGE
jgi:hypothetical protein